LNHARWKKFVFCVNYDLVMCSNLALRMLSYKLSSNSSGKYNFSMSHEKINETCSRVVNQQSTKLQSNQKAEKLVHWEITILVQGTCVCFGLLCSFDWSEFLSVLGSSVLFLGCYCCPTFLVFPFIFCAYLGTSCARVCDFSWFP
jgi:hypothetical protein